MASVNKKKKSETQISAADLIPGKWYLFKKHIPYKYFYIGKDSVGNLVFERFHKPLNENFGLISYNKKQIAYFYPIPESHKKYLYWLRSLLSGEINVIGPYTEPKNLNLSHCVLLKTEIITYTENS